MPNPHFDVQVISRRAGQSVVAAAAYRSGEVLTDERAGKTFDYSRKEDVVHAEIMAPAGTPDWANNRAMLWNKVEASEKRKDAQLARNIIAALPRELDQAQNLALMRGYIQENFIAKGMIADFAIHESEAGDGLKNPHAHILITMRPLAGDEFGKKNRDWNHKNTLKGWRHSWEELTNKHLELAGSPERLSLKSYEAQGKNKLPQVHLGEDAGNLEKRGIETKKGNHNRKVQHENALIEILAPEYEAELEVEGHQPPETGRPEVPNIDQRQGTEKIQDSGFKFLDADPAMRLEAMTLELKDEAETGNQKPGSGNTEVAQSESVGRGGKEASMGAFRNHEDDLEKLAESSLEASRAIHEAALREYVQAPQTQAARQQMAQNAGAKGYLERIKTFGERVYRQFANLMKESERLRERDKEDHGR